MDEFELPDVDAVASIYHRKQVEAATNEGASLAAEDGTNLMVEWAELPAEHQTSIKSEIEMLYEAIEEAAQLEDEGDDDEDDEADTTGTEAA